MRLISLCFFLLTGCFSMEDSVKNAKNKREILDSWASSIAKDFPAIKNVDAKQLDQFRIQSDKPLYILDHRNPDEQKVSLINGAVTTRDAFIKDLPDNARIVVYCTIGARSSEYIKSNMKTLKPNQEIYNLSGGILAWTFHQGQLVQPNKNPTKKVHVFGPAYNIVAEGYEGVSE